MKIGEVAAKAGCDVQTVRYYEREGLLEAPEREDSGYRRYSDKHLSRLQFIRHCRALDIPLAEVRQLLDYAECVLVVPRGRRTAGRTHRARPAPRGCLDDAGAATGRAAASVQGCQ